MAWEHAADYEPGTFGRIMRDMERTLVEIGPAGASQLAELDQFTSYFRQKQIESLPEEDQERLIRIVDNLLE